MREFKNYDEFEGAIDAIIIGRGHDLAPIAAYIHRSLEQHFKPHFIKKYYIDGIILPKYDGGDLYSFQVVWDQNIIRAADRKSMPIITLNTVTHGSCVTWVWSMIEDIF